MSEEEAGVMGRIYIKVGSEEIDLTGEEGEVSESFSKIFLDESIRSGAKFVEWKGPSGEMHRFRICHSGC